MGKMVEKLTKTQQAQIYCVKNFHADYVKEFWGEVYCGRCGSKIGDILMGFYNSTNVLIVGCKDKKCKTCPKIYKSLNKMDKEILTRMRKYPDKMFDTEWILEPIKIND
jgi:hypothetical protein